MIAKLVWPDKTTNSDGQPVDALWVECSMEEARAQLFPRLSAQQQGEFDELVVEDRNYLLTKAIPELGLREGSVYFLVAQDLSFVELHPWVYPHSGLWNAYCPFRTMPEFDFSEVSQLPNHARFARHIAVE